MDENGRVSSYNIKDKAIKYTTQGYKEVYLRVKFNFRFLKWTFNLIEGY